MSTLESFLSLLLFAERYRPDLLDELVVELVVVFQTTGRGW